MHVLIVEDDETTQQVIQQVLSQEETIETKVVGTGARAVDLAVSGGFDVVLLDYRLPDVDGLQVLQQLRQTEAPPAVVFLTGEGDEQVAYRALSEGAVDYLVKDPSTYRRLPDLLRKAHDEWGGLEDLLTLGASSQPQRRVRKEDVGEHGLAWFLSKAEVQGLLAHDAQGAVVVSALDLEGAETIAARSAALSHQTDQLASAGGVGADGTFVIVRGAEGVLARASAPDRMQILTLLEPGISPSQAMDLVRRAARIVRAELSDDPS